MDEFFSTTLEMFGGVGGPPLRCGGLPGGVTFRDFFDPLLTGGGGGCPPPPAPLPALPMLLEERRFDEWGGGGGAA